MLSVPFQRKKLTGIAEKCGNFFSTAGDPRLREARGQVADLADFNRVIRGIGGEVYLGARDATIFFLFLSPRSGSQKGSNFSWP